MVKKVLTLVLSVMITGSILTSFNFKEHNSTKDLVSAKAHTTVYSTIDPDADEV